MEVEMENKCSNETKRKVEGMMIKSKREHSG